MNEVFTKSSTADEKVKHYKKDLTGKTFGRLVVLEFAYLKEHCTYWKCLCECGAYTTPRGVSLTKGITKSCGCLKMGKRPENTTHGCSKTPEYWAWCAMKKRCYNKKDKGYKFYGARGIYVSDEWRDSFPTFLSDMGPRPSSEYSIDRINTYGPYSRNNCRWATDAEQGNNQRSNRRFDYKGESLTVAQLATRIGMKRRSLLWRLNHWPIEDAVTKSLR